MNIFQSIWKHPKVKKVQKKIHELDREHDRLSKELNHAKEAAMKEHKKKHRLASGHKRKASKTHTVKHRRRYY